MEGYTNISGNHEDFDDLDIEGRITLDEWNCEEDNQSKEESSNEQEEKRLLSIKVKLDEGGYGYVFSVRTTDLSIRWRCHLCDVLIIGQQHVDTHIQSKKHQVKMALPTHPAHLFTRLENKPMVEMPKLAPGEPVPPGFEDVVKRVTQIQATLDNYKTSPLIGLEYLVELVPDERGKEPMYVCMLCDKKGDPRVAMAHLTSFNHRSKYIGIHFPTANKAMFNEFPRTKDGRRSIAEIVTRICAKIEERYGRLQPSIVDWDMFDTNKHQIMKQIMEDHHFRETPDETFVNVVDISVLETLSANVEDQALHKSEKLSEDSKSTFNKGKISCDRSRLRIRGADDSTEEEIKSGKLGSENVETKEPGSKKMKLLSDEPNTKSISSVSSLTSSSHSRSQSRSLSRTRSQSRSKSRSRSRSRSGSRSRYRSRSRSYSRSRFVRHRWREGKYSRGSWSRSRRSHSGSRGWRRSRSGSKPRSRRSRSISPGSRYGRRGSPDGSPRRGHFYYGRSRSPKYNRYRDNQGEEKYGKHYDKSVRLDPLVIEKSKWVKFREAVDKMERKLVKDLKFHEKNPEKHLMYPEEWKKFWNRRYKELQAEGKDPSKHDFKPEWIDFWNKRMKEMHEEELKDRKEKLRLKLGLPKEEEMQPTRMGHKKRMDMDVIVISPPPVNEETLRKDIFKKDVTVTDIKNTWKALTGSDIKDTSKRSPSPWEDAENNSKHSKGSPPNRRLQRGGILRGRGRGGKMYGRKYCGVDEQDGSGVVTVLRLLTAMENQLGSLGPRVNTLLATSLSMEKGAPNSSNLLLDNPENFVLLETVKEKLKGQLLAGIVERNMVLATRTCIENLTDLLARAEENGPNSRPPLNVVVPAEPLPTVVPSKQSPIAEPVTVPGVGTMDKIAIAQQIAAALVAQGKTDVTQEELEQLINAVVGMAQASAGSEHPISTASFVSQLKQQQGIIVPMQFSAEKLQITTRNVEEKSPLQKLLSVVTSASSNISSSIEVKNKTKSHDSAFNALELLQSAYEEPRISPTGAQFISNKIALDISAKIIGMPPVQRVNKSDNMEDLTEGDLQNLLKNFKDLSSEEQQGLITYLKKLETKEPERVEKLRQFVNLESTVVQNSVQNTRNSMKPGILNRSSDQLGRLSPFSLRQGGINPSQESVRELDDTFSKNDFEDQKKPLKLEDSDDDYSFEDIYAAASKKVKEREKAKVEEEKLKKMSEDSRLKEGKSISRSDDPTVILKETKEMIANLMGQLPAKFIQKQSGSVGSRKDSPAVQGYQSYVQKDLVAETVSVPEEGQKITALGSETSTMTRPMQSVQPVPTLDSTQRNAYQSYSNSNSSYNSQYDRMQSFSTDVHNFPRNQQFFTGQQPSYSSGYDQSGGYYGGSQQQALQQQQPQQQPQSQPQPQPQQYSQHPGGNYNEQYQNQGPNLETWNNYTDQYGQHSYQRQSTTGQYSQYSTRPPTYY